MTRNHIEMVLVNEQNETIDDVALEKILVVSGLRYGVLRSDTGITFAKIHINDLGSTELHDITDENEFKLVESTFKSLPKC